MLWIRSFEMIVEREEFFSLLTKTFEANGMSDLLDSEKSDKLYRLTVRLLEENKKYNLTAITDLSRVVLNHYADSAVLCRLILTVPLSRWIILLTATNWVLPVNTLAGRWLISTRPRKSRRCFVTWRSRWGAPVF